MSKSWLMKVLAIVLVISMVSPVLLPASARADEASPKDWQLMHSEFLKFDGEIPGLGLTRLGGNVIRGIASWSWRRPDDSDSGSFAIGLDIHYGYEVQDGAPPPPLSEKWRNEADKWKPGGHIHNAVARHRDSMADYEELQYSDGGDKRSWIYGFDSAVGIDRRNYRGTVLVRPEKGDFLIEINASWNGAKGSPGGEMLRAVDLIEAYARGIVDHLNNLPEEPEESEDEKRVQIEIEYYCWTTTDETVIPGYVEVKLTDEKDEPITGTELFFFVDESDEFSKRLASFPTRRPTVEFSGVVGFRPASQYAVATTNQWGYAYLNILSEVTLTHHAYTGSFPRIRFEVCVADKEDGRADSAEVSSRRIVARTFFTIDLGGPVAIVDRGFKATPVGHSTDRSFLRVGDRTVDRLPFFVQGRETIYFDENTIFHVRWLDGTQMLYMAQPGTGQTYVDIECYGPGMYHRFLGYNIGIITATIGVGGAVLGLASSGPVAIGGAVVSLLVFVYEVGRVHFGELLVEPQSQILFDFSDDISVYTIEGTVTLHMLETGDTVEVIEGRMVTISEPGHIGTPTRFDESDLSADLLYLKSQLPAYEPHHERTPYGFASTDVFIAVIIGGMMLLAGIILVGGVLFVLRRRL